MGLEASFIVLVPRKDPSARSGEFCLSVRGRCLQFNFGTRARLAPYIKTACNQFGPFPQAAQAPVSGLSVLCQERSRRACGVPANDRTKRKLAPLCFGIGSEGR